MKNSKKLIGLLSLVVMLTVMGCKDKEADKEVIVMPGTTTVIEKETTTVDSSSGTSITVDKNGLKVEADKVDVKIGN